jgi:hypothetical protein
VNNHRRESPTTRKREEGGDKEKKEKGFEFSLGEKKKEGPPFIFTQKEAFFSPFPLKRHQSPSNYTITLVTSNEVLQKKKNYK